MAQYKNDSDYFCSIITSRCVVWYILDIFIFWDVSDVCRRSAFKHKCGMSAHNGKYCDWRRNFGRLSYISSVAVDLDLLSDSYRRCTVCTAGNSEQSIFRRRSEKNEKTFHSSRLDLCSHFHIRNRKDQLLDYDRSNRRADHCYYFICSEKRSQETGIVKRCSKI